jgi:miniconductance mechanosensitive channel
MVEEFNGMLVWLQGHENMYAAVCVGALFLGAWVANWFVKYILVRGFYRVLRSVVPPETLNMKNMVVSRLANIVPAIIISSGIHWIEGLPKAFVTVVENVGHAFIVLTIAMALAAVLNIINDLWQRRPDANMHPIKGYVQVGKLVIYLIATILMIATLIDRSPLILLSGIGAMAAVLMLIFQDTLLSLVASVQITSNDIIRVGDWVEIPQLNADGAVIDIALHTVKVQNWDKTITTIPTKRFITDAFKNWRGMQESGGRRIKRSLFLDQNSVGFLSEEDCARLGRFNVLKPYLDSKLAEIDTWNNDLAQKGIESVNARRVTNIGTFRAYVEHYLRHHPGIHKEMSLMVRQMPLSAEGLPLELYCFTNVITWVEYEGIQSDIFDHLLAILPEFGLRVFQSPSGADLQNLRIAGLQSVKV